MNKNEKIVIAGAGISGTTAAKTLRNEGFSGDITLIDGDKILPFDRPPLSKKYLTNKISEDEIALAEENFYKNEKINLLLNRKIINIDISNKNVTIHTGKKLTFDKLLIATGSKIRTLDSIKGSNLKGIHYLKTLTHAKQFKKGIEAINNIVIVGGGFIGLEVAASLIEMGKNVTVIDSGKYPLAKLFGEEIGRYIAKVHSDKGVNFLSNRSIIKFGGEIEVEYVLTNEGDKVNCDMALVSIGVLPNTRGFENLFNANKGIIVNEYCETSTSNIYAAGDCTVWPYKINGEMIRVEHWDHAINQGKTAALNMIERESNVYNSVPYFWSDQLHLYIQYLGKSSVWDYKVLRGSINNNKFTIFYIYQNRIAAALIINTPKNAISMRKLIQKKVKVNPQELEDSNKSLKKIYKNKSVRAQL